MPFTDSYTRVVDGIKKKLEEVKDANGNTLFGEVEQGPRSDINVIKGCYVIPLSSDSRDITWQSTRYDFVFRIVVAATSLNPSTSRIDALDAMNRVIQAFNIDRKLQSITDYIIFQGLYPSETFYPSDTQYPGLYEGNQIIDTEFDDVEPEYDVDRRNVRAKVSKRLMVKTRVQR